MTAIIEKGCAYIYDTDARLLAAEVTRPLGHHYGKTMFAWIFDPFRVEDALIRYGIDKVIVSLGDNEYKCMYSQEYVKAFNKVFAKRTK